MNIKREIKEVIDQWDPIDLLPFAPSDEYDFESEKIYRRMKEKSEVEDQYLTEIIYDVFTESFGKNVFLKTNECKYVAEDMMKHFHIDR